MAVDLLLDALVGAMRDLRTNIDTESLVGVSFKVFSDKMSDLGYCSADLLEDLCC